MFSSSRDRGLPPAAGPPPAAWAPAAPYRLALWLVLASTAVPLGLLVASEFLGGKAAGRIAVINRASQLRYRTLEVYLAGQGQAVAGRDAATAWAELAAVRGEVAAAAPGPASATDPAWHALAAAAAVGPPSRAATEQHLRAADGLVFALEADAATAAHLAGRLFWLGVASLCVTLVAGLTLAARIRQLAVRMSEREAHFRTFMDTGPAAAFVKDEAGRYYYANKVCEERFGLTAGTSQHEVFDPAFVHALRANDRATLSGDRTVVMEECVPEPSGRLTYWLTHKFPLTFADGRRLLGGLSIDITDMKRAEDARRTTEQRLLTVVGSLPALLHVVGREGLVELDEGRGLEGVGRRAGGGVGWTWEQTAGGGPGPVERLRRALAGETVQVTTERDGRWYDVTYSPQFGDAGQVTSVLVLAIDVTERQSQLELIQQQNRELEAARRELELLARNDALTGVFNRRALDERLADEVARAVRLGAPLGVILADLDHFKRLNDDLGHPAGDRTLRAVADALRGAVREIDTVARYGGEEFCVLLPGADAEAAAVAAERLRAAVAGCDLPDRPVTASLGVAAWVPGTEGGAELLAAADRALYRAKAAGRNRVAAAPQLVAVTV